MNTSTATGEKSTAFGALLARAINDFPAAFKGKPRPLVRGARHLLVAAWPDQSQTAIRKFIGLYCASRLYLLAVAAGGPRYYFDGSPDGDVTAEEQQIARDRLDARQARNLATYTANLELHQQRRRERQEAAFADEAAREERPPAPPPAPPSAVSVEAPRPARPTLRLNTVQVRGANRQAREVQVVTKRKFSRSNEGASQA
jgi:sRNA-binding protein